MSVYKHLNREKIAYFSVPVKRKKVKVKISQSVTFLREGGCEKG